MTTYQEARIATLERKLKARTQRDGKPKPGYEQNVAQIKAELAQLSVQPSEENQNGE